MRFRIFLADRMQSPAVRINLIPEVNCVVSSSAEETVEKIKYYLNYDNQRIRIAKAGRDYAIKHFAYQNTLTEVWPKILAEFRADMLR
ncbi:glycosyltransferase [Brevibacillus laterosporus]|uniref:glycosyltransferase n=1 Tax=Brevibacillus laterosporus TaxID=1465 RepID=UPI002E1EB51D|nr:glycosyltransferase [Brevibacillus laterosporus]